MGSEISKAYAVDEAPTGTAGLSGMWKLHKGIHRETGEAVTVWIFHPTDALSGLKNKAVKGVLLDCMRRDITNMKVMKHPKIPEVSASRCVAYRSSEAVIIVCLWIRVAVRVRVKIRNAEVIECSGK